MTAPDELWINPWDLEDIEQPIIVFTEPDKARADVRYIRAPDSAASGAGALADRGERTHIVKCWTEAFAAVVAGTKTYEIRRNDRDYREGDVITLREWNPLSREYTGASATFRIGTVIKGAWEVPNDMAVFSLLPVAALRTSEPGGAVPREPVAWCDPLDLAEARDNFMVGSHQYKLCRDNLRYTVPLYAATKAGEGET